MTKQFFLDTSVVINYIKGKSPVVEFVDKLQGEVVCSYIVLSELYEGIYRSKHEVESKILDYFGTFDKVYGVDKAISREFGKIRSVLKKSGIIIEDLDILIAATCIAYNLTLITQNQKHFDRIEDLKILYPNDKSN